MTFYLQNMELSIYWKTKSLVLKNTGESYKYQEVLVPC